MDIKLWLMNTLVILLEVVANKGLPGQKVISETMSNRYVVKNWWQTIEWIICFSPLY